MKKSLSIILIALSLFVLCSCGKKEPTIPCSIEVICTDALTCETLSAEKLALLPADGVIVAKCDTLFAKGETAFDILQRILMENKVHFEFNTSSGDGSKYIEGISNLYQYDCGEYSGWSYFVNDEMPSVGASGYKLSEGDALRFVYVSDFTKAS